MGNVCRIDTIGEVGEEPEIFGFTFFQTNRFIIIDLTNIFRRLTPFLCSWMWVVDTFACRRIHCLY